MKIPFFKGFLKAVLIIFLATTNLWAADPNPEDSTFVANNNNSAPAAPIDGGTLALIAGGAILGFRSWQQRKTEQNAKS